MEGLQVLFEVLSALDAVESRYYLCGSMASTLHGVPRFTQDFDLVADLSTEQAEEFADRLSGEFYVDREAVAGAILHGRSFNAIHLRSGWKIDLFVGQRDPFHQEEMRRRTLAIIRSGEAEVAVPIATPEDTVLSKLRWYRSGGEVSQKQWGDLEGMIRLGGDKLDREYLRHWAGRLGVADLLEKLLAG